MILALQVSQVSTITNFYKLDYGQKMPYCITQMKKKKKKKSDEELKLVLINALTDLIIETALLLIDKYLI